MTSISLCCSVSLTDGHQDLTTLLTKTIFDVTCLSIVSYLFASLVRRRYQSKFLVASKTYNHFYIDDIIKRPPTIAEEKETFTEAKECL